MLPFIEFWMKGRKQNVTLWLRRSSLSGSSRCLLYNPYVVSSDIFVLDQLNNPGYSHHLSAWYGIDIVRRNSVLVIPWS